MKKIIVATVFMLAFYDAYFQNKETEREIKILEEKVVQAILKKDSATLRKIWTPGFMVNSPRNMVLTGGQVDLVMKGVISYTSYTFEMESILEKGDIVISMGNETVVPVIGNPKGGQIIRRRYTHFWEKLNGSWRLIARHANEICK